MVKYTPVSGIYVILNTKTKNVYIGQAKDLRKRRNRHILELKEQYHGNPHLQRAWNKYGAKVFKFQVLEYCPVDKLDEREQHFLDIYIPKGLCYNIVRDVRSPGRGIPQSEETRHKKSITKMGALNPMFGKPLSEDHRRKIGDGVRGKTLSEETRKKISLSHTGVRPSAETRQKMSSAKKGKPNGRAGFKHTDATKLKISETKKRNKNKDKD